MYPQRWSASETTIGQNKTLVTDAGPSRGSILRSGEPDLVLQEFYAWLTAGQLVRKAVYDTAAQAAGKPVETAQVSFTATRHEVTRPITQTLVTATTSLDALTAATETASRAVLTRLLTPGRDRHSDRRRKHQPRFPRTRQTTPPLAGRPPSTSAAPRSTRRPEPLTHRPTIPEGADRTTPARSTAPIRSDIRRSDDSLLHPATTTEDDVKDEPAFTPKCSKSMVLTGRHNAGIQPRPPRSGI